MSRIEFIPSPDGWVDVVQVDEIAGRVFHSDLGAIDISPANGLWCWLPPDGFDAMYSADDLFAIGNKLDELNRGQE